LDYDGDSITFALETVHALITTLQIAAAEHIRQLEREPMQ